MRLLLMFLSALPILAIADGTPLFDENAIRASIQTLSSDEFGGRAPGSAGEKLTLDYLTGKFKEYGLAPADGKSFLQAVPMKQITADPDTRLEIRGRYPGDTVDLAYGTDMVVSSPRTDKLVTLKASPLVFAGYGVVAPEYHWNDYAGLDVKGKTVVVLVNDPGWDRDDPQLFEGKAMTYYGRWTYKYEEAARQGAAGILIVHDTDAAGYPWEVVQGSWTGPLEELPPGKGHQLAIQGWISHDAANRLFRAGGMQLADFIPNAGQPGFKPIRLPLTASITLHDTVKDIVSHNVTALVKGSKRPDQVLVYSAHWDHLGTRKAADGTTEVFHGAADNGSGIAGLLAIARAMAQAKPERSVLFLATTSEEQGLLGAAYYAAHPLFPLKQTVADLNMDVLDTYGATHNETVRGRFMSGVDDVFIVEAAKLGLKVEQDAQPEKGMYFRADHFEFAKAGVPAMSIALGTDYVGHPAGWGLTQQRAYTAQRYHKPADVYEPGWDLAGMLQQLQLMYATGLNLANSPDWPAWKDDSPFKAKRGQEKPPK